MSGSLTGALEAVVRDIDGAVFACLAHPVTGDVVAQASGVGVALLAGDADLLAAGCVDVTQSLKLLASVLAAEPTVRECMALLHEHDVLARAVLFGGIDLTLCVVLDRGRINLAMARLQLDECVREHGGVVT
jgi:hypothetical protein